MNYEQLLKEAERRCKSPIPGMHGICARNFADGARWRIQSVWHTNDEMPETHREVIYITQNGWVDTWHVISLQNWKDAIEDYGLIHWAYVADLLPQE